MPATSKNPAADQLAEPDLLVLLPWCVSLLLVLYAVGVGAAVVPLQPGTPAWQLRFCEALINQSPLVLMGLGLALIGQASGAELASSRRLLRWTARAALPLSLGFALLIPLQAAASVQLLRNADHSATVLLRNTDSNLAAARAAIRQARTGAELETIANRLPGGLIGLLEPDAILPAQQQRLLQGLEQLRGRSLLQLQLASQQQRTQVVRNSLRLSLLAALLAALFQQARPRRQRGSNRWRLTLPRWRWPARERVHAMARYCNDTEGRG
jgi:hypothetical protein